MGKYVMRMSKLLVAVAASALIATPAMANSAAPLSVAKAMNAKAATSAKKSNKQFGALSPLYVIGAIVTTVAVLEITGAIDIFDSSDSP